MADFTGKDNDLPIIGTVLPRQNKDLGALITLTAQGAGTVNSLDQVNVGSRGVRATVDITAKTGTIDVTVNIQRKDVASGKYVTLLASASLTGTGTTTYTVHPNASVAANVSINDFLGEIWRVQVVNGAGSSPSTTATIGACLLA